MAEFDFTKVDRDAAARINPLIDKSPLITLDNVASLLSELGYNISASINVEGCQNENLHSITNVMVAALRYEGAWMAVSRASRDGASAPPPAAASLAGEQP